VVRIDPNDWSIHPFVQDRLLRPIDVRYEPNADAFYVLDFGYFEMADNGKLNARNRTGKLWRCSF
jgi:hypothetical protein